MALQLSPVRLFIADDVGIGKTIEAALIANELLDRGDAKRLAVLCPPHLAEQWQAELGRQVPSPRRAGPPLHRQAARALPARSARSLFEVFPHVIVSTDFIKSERRRHDFIRAALT